MSVKTIKKLYVSHANSDSDTNIPFDIIMMTIPGMQGFFHD